MIGIENDDGTVLASMCQYDGQVHDGVGQTLHENYRDEEKIRELIEGGEARYIDPGAVEYFTDGSPAGLFRELSDAMDYFFSEGWQDYFYIWRNAWFVFSLNDGPFPVSFLLRHPRRRS